MTHVDCPIVPVLDLMIGQIVLAVAGDRQLYRPVHSRLTSSSDPMDVVMAMFNQTGCKNFYLADIDTFEGAAPNWTIYQRLAERGFRLWVDADWSGARADQLIELAATIGKEGAVTPIVSTETISAIDDLQLIAKLNSAGLQTIFSLDLKDGKLLTKAAKESALAKMEPAELVEQAVEHGVDHALILDVAKVGTQSGSAHLELVKQIHGQFPQLRLSSGGGIRTADDAAELLDAGCKHVLVASAIHECAFTPDDVTWLEERRLV